jgi:hypothetical protein
VDILLRKPAGKSLIYVIPDFYRAASSRGILEAPWEPVTSAEERDNVEWELPDQQGDGRVVLLDEASSRPPPRIIDPEYIDIGPLRRWLSTCRREHHEKCGSTEFQYTSRARPRLLIDTVNRCLVYGNELSTDYIALSYLWGGMNQFLTTVENLESLTAPGALDDVPNMPRTVRETIALTRALGERYLWIDALCIVQNDESQKRELNNMASIFANASLTVVNVDGANADAGFRGLRNISMKRQANQRIVKVSNQQQMLKPSSRQIWSGSMLAPWSTRAWTFQEEICSRRILYFAHGSVRWACRTCRWSEESTAADCMSTYASSEQLQLSLDSPRLSNSPLPQLSEYQALVNAFNTRALTFPEDTLLAFAGISARLGDKFVGGMISGMPELFFDLCLLWRPQHRLGPPKRRQSSGKQKSSSVLPSWSWAGWETEVTWPFTWNRPSEIAAPIPVLLGDIVPFFQIDIHYIGADFARQHINSTWSSHAHDAMSSRQIPLGWKKHNAVEKDRYKRDQVEESSWYAHISDPNSSFYLPIPLGEVAAPPRNVRQIGFSTSTGHFKLGDRHRFMTTILASEDTTVGILWQHDDSDPAYVEAIETGATIQLIAILGCTVPKDDYLTMLSSSKLNSYVASSDDHPQKPPSRIKEVMQVMWIQWTDKGVASRKGTGQIERAAWDLHAERQSIDVLLE